MLYVIFALLLIVAAVLIGLVLIQKGRGGGLISALGSGGHSLLGSKTAPVVTWVTSAMFFLFLVLSIVMNLLANQN